MIEKFYWKSKIVLPTRTAQDEMFKEGIDMHKVINILNKGFDSARSKRAKGVYERAVRKGNKIIKVVVVDKGEYFLLIHVGSFTISKKIKKLMREKNETRFR